MAKKGSKVKIIENTTSKYLLREVAWRSDLRGIVCILCVLIMNVSASAIHPYQYEIIAQTGTSVGDSNPVDLSDASSINDTGKVAFIARDQAGSRGRVILIHDGNVERNFIIGNPATVSDYVQVNNADQIIFRQGFDDGLVSHINRLDSSSGGVTIASGSLTTAFSAPFDIVLPWTSLNNNGRGVFSADVDSFTILGSRAGGSGDHDISPGLTGFPNLFPMIADNNTTVIRWGGTNDSPLLRFINTDLDTANFIAESDQFNAIGEMPGISDDGIVVVFFGDHKTEGGGIFISLFNGADFSPKKIVGLIDHPPVVPIAVYVDSNNTGVYELGEEDIGRFGNFSIAPRVAVNRTCVDSIGKYAVVYIAFDINETMGLYVSHVDINNPELIRVSEPSLVVEVGSHISELEGKVNNIHIYDPINNASQIALTVHTENSTEAVVRASPPKHKKLVFITHGWNSNTLVWSRPMRNNIVNQLKNSFHCNVVPLSWSEDNSNFQHASSSEIDWEVVDYNWPDRASSFEPYIPLWRGRALGRQLGDHIHNYGYKYIHLIGHSSGVGIVDAIADTISKRDAAAGLDTDIHITLLDAFVPIYMKSIGDNADWVEQYVEDSKLGSTSWTLPHAFNIDLDSVEQSTEEGRGHSWPWKWYLATTENPLESQYNGVPIGPYGWGFQRTIEFSSLHPDFNSYVKGKRIDIRTGECIEVFKDNVNISSTDVDLNLATITISTSGQVTDISESGFVMTTGSPVWLSANVDLADDFSMVQFEYEFLSSSDGVLSVFVNGDQVFEDHEIYSDDAEHSGWIWLGQERQPGLHNIVFQLDPNNVQSSVAISNIEVGAASVLGDITNDKDTNYSDFAVIHKYWLQNETLADIAPLPNGDGVVDILDFIVLAENWMILTSFP